MPLFAQGGAIFPIRDGAITFANKEHDKRGLLVFPSQTNDDIEKVFYEDDGETVAYKKGDTSWLQVKMTTTDQEVDVTVVVRGNYILPYEQIRVYFPDTEKRTIIVNGETLRSDQAVFEMLLNE
ncbi:DUF5110 domain-containing protein [Litoribacterium kuwaitense]|uniref:DUF5110 domain-containing protein n=1 Tax=Litoribacterium kuwaitense TaxID=1398745 RepID=UPI0035E3F697